MPVVNNPGNAGYTLWSPTLPTLAQRGPTCGFYALSYVSMALDQFIPHTKNKRQALSVYGFKPDYSLRSVGKKLGLTQVGEIFNSDHMVQLAAQFGITATRHQVNGQSFVATVTGAIDLHRPVLVPYNVYSDRKSPSHGHPDPDRQTGENPHWCTVVGYRNDQGATSLLVYNWSKYYAYDAGELQRANQNIQDWGQQSWGKVPTDRGLKFERVKPNTHYLRVARFEPILLGATLANTVVTIDSGRTRPTWVPDSNRTRCNRCNTKFGTFTRKHHCRQCGEIFCDSCSNKRMVVYLPATRPGKTERQRSDGKVRVCRDCYANFH